MCDLAYTDHTETCITFSTWLSFIANYPEHVVERLPPDLVSGVYYGWASVDQGPVYKMVMSVGWNPQWQNEKRSMVCVCVCVCVCVRAG